MINNLNTFSEFVEIKIKKKFEEYNNEIYKSFNSQIDKNKNEINSSKEEGIDKTMNNFITLGDNMREAIIEAKTSFSELYKNTIQNFPKWEMTPY